MKTLSQIKNEIAIKKGYFSWPNLISSGHLTITLNTIDELLIIVQKECLKNASKNVKSKLKEDYLDLSMNDDWTEVDKDSITNENNIIK